MKDTVVLGLLLVSFATFLTAHVAISVRLLLQREARWRGALALVAAPRAPLFAFRRGWRASAGIWVGAVVVYAIALIVALR